MIPKECKRLAEVDFPIAEVSRQAVREKSIRHGHPSTLHLWWARRPLASSRAVLMALLLPDPCDAHCPAAFKRAARRILLAHDGRPKGWLQEIEPDDGLRRILLKFIADFANWDKAANPAYLETSRALVRAAHGEEPPLVVDPFAGGGSIPLEALRVGCEAFASDLNPVACLILKVMLEDIPRHGPKLAEELREAGRQIKEQAEQELADLYPKDPDGATPIAYLWARTVRCEAPNCGAEMPLMRSFWLCKKPKRRRALRPSAVRRRGERPEVEFEVFEPTAENGVHSGTVNRAKATCLCCGTVLPPERVRSQLGEQRGGADVIFDDAGKRVGGARMTAVVTLRPRETGRHYRLPTDADYVAVRRAGLQVAEVNPQWVPDEPTPSRSAHRAVGSQLHLYRMEAFRDLFTARQRLTLATLCRLVASRGDLRSQKLLAMCVSRLSNIANCLCRWESTRHQVLNLFSRQAFPMVWDFAESSFLGAQAGDYSTTMETVARAVDRMLGIPTGGHVELADATDSHLPNESAAIWFTDPPYYDAIPYSDLSDFFLVWLKRALPGHLELLDPFEPSNALSPKLREAVQCEKVLDAMGYPKDRIFYERKMADAFLAGRHVLKEDGVGSVVFAHKTTEGWEALLSGMIQGGWTITGSWPISTELGERPNAQETAALATSVHLICRPPPRKRSRRRLGRCPARTPQARRRLDAALARRGRAWCRSRVRLCRPGARNLQPLSCR